MSTRSDDGLEYGMCPPSSTKRRRPQQTPLLSRRLYTAPCGGTLIGCLEVLMRYLGCPPTAFPSSRHSHRLLTNGIRHRFTLFKTLTPPSYQSYSSPSFPFVNSLYFALLLPSPSSFLLPFFFRPPSSLRFASDLAALRTRP